MKRFLFALLLTGCAVGPNYHPPKPNLPAAWNAGTTNAVDQVTVWWKTFKDPQLDSLIDRAIRTNLDLRIATARVREARALRSSVATDFLPAINADGSYTKARRSANAQLFTLPKLDTDTYELGFDARWEIDLFGGRRRALEQANALMAAIVEDRQSVRVTLSAEVARNYMDVRGAQRRLAITQRHLAVLREAVQLTQARFNAGLVGELDVTQAKAQLAAVEAAAPVLETAAHRAMHRLAVLLALPPAALIDELSKGTPIPEAPPEVPAGLPADLLRRRPDIRSCERDLAAATAGIGMQVAELFPKLSLTGVAGFQSLHGSDLIMPASRFWSAGPMVQWRLLDIPSIRAKIRAQSARQEQSLARYEQAVLGALEEVENALVTLAGERIRLKALTDGVTASQRAAELAMELYRKGLVDFLRVLDAERAVELALDQQAESQRALAQSVVALYKALGGGWEMSDEK